MNHLELPCSIGDIVYFITAWNKYSLQPKNFTRVTRIEIIKNEIIVHTEFNRLLLSNYQKTWFCNKENYNKQSKIIRELYIKEQELRKELSS